MIPYDDLVARLQSWRARQGLPVSGLPDPPGSRLAPATMVEDNLEVLEEDHDHDLSLSTIDSDEATPIGGMPEPRR